MSLSGEDYARLLTLRTGLRRFERWSAQQAEAAGLTPAQHQLLLAVRGHIDPLGPTVGEVADYLLLQHHSTVELIDRAVSSGLVRRTRDKVDQRIVRIRLTAKGSKRIESLSALHLQELDRLELDLPSAWDGLAPDRVQHGLTGNRSRVAPAPVGRHVEIGRVYGLPPKEKSYTVLVDRLWPRGISKQDAPFDQWSRDVAPSSELRKWYGHEPGRFDQFTERYLGELTRAPAKDALEDLRDRAAVGNLKLVTATKDVEISAAKVLARVLTD